LPKTSLDINPFWPEIHFYDRLDSTNARLKQLAEQGQARHGAVVHAGFQEKGRGQLGNTWKGEPNQNLYFSLLLEPNLIAENQYVLNKAVSVAICSILAQHNLNAQIKWPNDILVNNKKIAGILIENSLAGTIISKSIIGIGINVNQTVFTGFPNASGLAAFSKQVWSINLLRDELLDTLNGTIQLPKKQLDLQYEQLLWSRNEITTFAEDERYFKGIVKGVDEQGQLRILVDGKEKRFMNKEITWKGW